MRMARRIRGGAPALLSLLLLSLFCFAGTAQPLGADINTRMDAETMETNGDQVLVEGVLRGGTFNFFCCTGYPFAMDDTCRMPIVIVGGPNLGDYVDSRVRVTGSLVNCPPPALCPCRIEKKQEAPSIDDRDRCMVVETIEEIAACSE